MLRVISVMRAHALTAAPVPPHKLYHPHLLWDKRVYIPYPLDELEASLVERSDLKDEIEYEFGPFVTEE